MKRLIRGVLAVAIFLVVILVFGGISEALTGSENPVIMFAGLVVAMCLLSFLGFVKGGRGRRRGTQSSGGYYDDYNGGGDWGGDGGGGDGGGSGGGDGGGGGSF